MSPAGAKDITVPDRGNNPPVCSANKVINPMKRDFIVFAAAKSAPTDLTNGPNAVFSSKSRRNLIHTTTFTPVVKQVMPLLHQ